MADQPAPVAAPPLPRTWRPVGARIAAAAFSIVLIGAFAGLWLRFDDQTRESVNVYQRGTVIAIVFLGVALMHGLARSRVIAREDGLVVLNGYRRRVLAWDAVGTVRMPQGAPWPHLERGDDKLMLLGIQTSDGPRAAMAVRELRAVVSAHAAPTDEPG